MDFHSGFIPIAMKVEGEAGGDVLMSYSLRSERSKKNFDLMLTHPNLTVLVTYNGQVLDLMSVDQLNPRLRSEFSYLCGSGTNDLIVELALDRLKREARNSILTATRAAIQKKAAWNRVLKDAGDYIIRCGYLLEFNKGRREKSLTASGERSKSDEEGVAYAMRYVSGLLGPGKFSTGGAVRVIRPRQPKVISLNKDRPTEIKFLTKETNFNLDSKNRRYPLWIETNAPNGYNNPDLWVEDADGKVVSSPKVGILQGLNGGRVRAYVDLKNEMVGDMGTIVAHYDGTEDARIDYTVINEKPVPRHPRKAVKGTGTQKGSLAINYQPVNPSHPQWNRFHLTKEQVPEFSFDVKSGTDGAVDVFYSDEKFPPSLTASRTRRRGRRRSL